ncbi:MAG: serine hydrolase [Sedimentisphaerales bacterium]|nr:serine hydrolase [Sedimentisphaerales bacterium]NLT75837.1 serine hydrolase [Planctomycetota bacterium]
MTRMQGVLAVVLAIASFAMGGQEDFEWHQAAPEAEGMSSRKLDEATQVLSRKGTKTFLVIRNDKIVHEWYAPDFDATQRHYTASLAKALVGGVSLMLALNDGRLGADDPACNYIPQWKEHPEKSKITIRHLATHSSGIEDAEQDGIPHSDLPGWKGQFWKREPDPFSVSRDHAPVLFEPGSKYAYSNPGMAMLSYAITAALRGTEHTDVRTLLRQRIMRPIGVSDSDWSIGYGATYTVDDLNLVANWGGGGYTARAVARVGRLMLRKGNWQGRQLVEPQWVQKVVEYAGTPLPDRPAGNPQPASGLGWWTNADGVWPKVPRDAFAGAGAGNQVLLVVPSLDMIVVRNGGNLFDASKGEGFWGGIERYVFNPVMEAVVSPPYPPSQVIAQVEWAPADTVIRKANGSDNWPITWADDDNLYTAYGDGWGLAPKVDQKLSLGFAKVIGGPKDFVGVNIRTETGERRGDGPRGPKASGMLCVDGVLYMFVRNIGNSQIAWSEDYARTWRWSDWKFETSFGAPTFVNFGRNYAGARDDYVYVYSNDCDTAYEAADRMVMARVPKDEMRHRDAYEFFQGLDAQGQPLWTRDIHGRGAVFVHPGRCYRSGISYNAGLQRYLWCQTLPESTDSRGPRYQGGFGIYEAPEPWGPWRTVFFTETWDTGPGESSSLPPKWMSDDGQTCHLLFSGDDCFSTRRVEFR